MAGPRFVVQYKMEKKPNRARAEETLERTPILVGSRPMADVYVPDRLVPEEAASLDFDGRRLLLTVKSRLAGVFVNGAPVEGTGPVPHAAALQIGHCLIEVSIDAANETCTLVVGERYLSASVAAVAKKAAAPFALTESGPQEQRWGRTRVLTTWNWIAAFGGLLLLAAFPATRDTAVVNRGALSKAHAPGSEFFTKGCEGCHSAFSSDYASKCVECHEEFDSERHHPYSRATEWTCDGCHPEHRGADADLVPAMDAVEGGWPRTCARCHAGEDRDAKVAAALAAPDAPSKVRDRPAAKPLERWLLIDGFSHADHRVPRPPRASLAGGTTAPQGDVPVPCVKCHARPESKDAPGAAAGADFALVQYETCLSCHAEWRVEVHGRDRDGVHCLQCHARAEDPSKITRDIRTAEVAATGSLYDVVPRVHDFAKEDCRACHVEEKAAAPRTEPLRLAFRHDHHIRTVTPGKGGELALAATCVRCHDAVAASSSLAGLGTTLAAARSDVCRECHTAAAPVPVPGTSTRRIVDMFHSVHTVEPGTAGALRPLAGRETLSGGCLSCHVPGPGAEPMKLREGAADCSACHKGHESLGGGKCALCHVDRAAPENRDERGLQLYRRNEAGIFAREKATMKTTAPVRWFDHFSSGHAADAADPSGAGCVKCHDGAAVDGAQRVLDVPWPGPSEPGCVQCHVRDRYHR